MAAGTEKNEFLDGLTAAMFHADTGGRSERLPLLGRSTTREQDQQQQDQQQQDLRDPLKEPDAVELLEKLPLLLVRAVAVFTMATTSSCVLAAVSAPANPCSCDTSATNTSRNRSYHICCCVLRELCLAACLLLCICLCRNYFKYVR